MKFEKGQTVIFEIDVYNNGNISEYDGFITSVDNGKIDVNYLEGYKDRHDRINPEDIVALVDETRKCKYYKTDSYSGYLIPNPLFKSRRVVVL